MGKTNFRQEKGGENMTPTELKDFFKKRLEEIHRRYERVKEELKDDLDEMMLETLDNNKKQEILALQQEEAKHSK